MRKQTLQQDNTAKKQTGARRRFARIAFAAALMCMLLAAVGCGKKKASDNGTGTQTGGAEATAAPEVTQEPVVDYDCILENDDLKLVMDHLTSQITVTDKATGMQWRFDNNEWNPNATFTLGGTNSDSASFRIRPAQAEITVTYTFFRWNLEKDWGYIVPPYMTEEAYNRYRSAFREADAHAGNKLQDAYQKCDVNSNKLREVEKERLLEEYPFLQDGVYYVPAKGFSYSAMIMAPDFADAGYSKEQYLQDLAFMQKEDTVSVDVRYYLDGRNLHVAVTTDLAEVDWSNNNHGSNIEILPYFDQGTERIYDDQEAYYGCMRGDSAFLCYMTSDPANASCRIRESDDGFLYCEYGHGDAVDISVCYRFVASGSEDDLRSAYEGN